MTFDEEEFEGAIILEPQKMFNSAVVGFAVNSHDERVICYDYDLLIEAYIDNMSDKDKKGMTDSDIYMEACDYISSVTIREIDYISSNRKPIIIYPIDFL